MSILVENKSTNHIEHFTVKHVRFGQNGVWLDFTPVYNAIVINEDIESGFVQGYILILDNVLGPKDSMNGTEYLDISFTSTGANYEEFDSYTKQFRITKFEQEQETNAGNVRLMRLNFVSNPSVYNDSIKLRRSYENTTPSEFISHICDVLGSTMPKNIEETLYTQSFVAPNVSPLDMVNWIKTVSISKSTLGSDFYFWENRDGINYQCLDTMKNKKVKHVLRFLPPSEMFNYKYNAILSIHKPKGYDIQDDIRHGGAGATLYTQDLVTKEYIKHIALPESIPTLNPVNPRGEGYESNTDAYVKYWPHEGVYEVLDLGMTAHSVMARSMSKTTINFRTIVVEIPGNVDIMSGDIVELKIPGSDGGKSLKIDESGKYLVKKLRHIITQSSIHTQLELVTDSNIERNDN